MICVSLIDLCFLEIPTEPQTRLAEVKKLQGDDVEGLISNDNVLLAGLIPKGNLARSILYYTL